MKRLSRRERKAYEEGRAAGYAEGYVDGLKEGLKDEPIGKWIDHSEDYGYVECPKCEHLTNCEGNIDELHYCWNCGAKLKGGNA
jgi:hypothetical protein